MAPDQNPQTRSDTTHKLQSLFDASEEQQYQQLCRYGLTDAWLPLRGVLVEDWLDPGLKKRFLKNQNQPGFLDSELQVAGPFPMAHHNLPESAMKDGIPSTIQRTQVLGTGGTAKVLEVECAGQTFALKRYARERNSERARTQMQYIVDEIKIMRKFRPGEHHLIKLIGSYTSLESIGILLSPVAQRNLAQYLMNFKHERTPKTERELRGFIGCLSTATYLLHNRYHVRHKDIKPGNVLVQDGKIIVTDFGISRDWSDTNYTTTNQETMRNAYSAPETDPGHFRRSKSDIWPLGCIFLEIMAVLNGETVEWVRHTVRNSGNREPLYRDNHEGLMSVIEELEEQDPMNINGPYSWIRDMVQVDQEKRPNSSMLTTRIINHQHPDNIFFFGPCCVEKPPINEEDSGGEEEEEEKDDDDESILHSISHIPSSASSAPYPGTSSSSPPAPTGSSISPPPLSTQQQPPTRLWGTILESDGDGRYDARIRDSTETSVNWIDSSLVMRYKLTKETLAEPQQFIDFNNEMVTVKESVSFTWRGSHYKTYFSTYYISSSCSPFDIVLGDKFVKEKGPAKDICAWEPMASDDHVIVPSRGEPNSFSLVVNHGLRNDGPQYVHANTLAHMLLAR